MHGREKGFTLIEIIGVLAIMAILASVLAPNIAREITRSRSDAEERELEAIMAGLKSSIVSARSIPAANTGAGGWNSAVEPYLSVPAARIIQSKGVGVRRLIIQPTSGLGPLPYNQTARFTAGPALFPGNLPVAIPVQPRFVLISTLNAATPILNLNDGQFDNVWNQTAPIPAGFTESGETKIVRLNLAPLFQEVVVNCESIAGTPRITIDGSAQKSVTVGIVVVYLLSGTRITLFSGAPAIPGGVVVVGGPIMIRYNGTAWIY